jgi:UDP-glucuronate 4-epimerase
LRVIVTGGAGFIGSHVCEALAARGDQIYCLDNFNDYYVNECGERHKDSKTANISGLKTVHNFHILRDEKTGAFCDITSIKSLESLLPEKADALVHLAAQAGVRAKASPESYQQANVEGTENILNYAAKRGAKKFIIASSSSVYGDNPCVPWSETSELKPRSAYAKSKAEMERLCEKFADENRISMAVLRFFTVYGPRGRPDMFPYKLIDGISRGTPITKFGDGTSERDYTYVGDIVDGIIRVIDDGCRTETINLGNSSPVALNELIWLAENVTGRKARILAAPEQPCDVARTYADITKARRLLNWEPKTPIEQGLLRMYEWYRKARIDGREKAA